MNVTELRVLRDARSGHPGRHAADAIAARGCYKPRAWDEAFAGARALRGGCCWRSAGCSQNGSYRLSWIFRRPGHGRHGELGRGLRPARRRFDPGGRRATDDRRQRAGRWRSARPGRSTRDGAARDLDVRGPRRSMPQGALDRRPSRHRPPERTSPTVTWSHGAVRRPPAAPARCSDGVDNDGTGRSTGRVLGLQPFQRSAE